MHWYYHVAVVMVKMLMLLLTRWDVRGKENVPSQGAVMIVANHMNLADPPLLGVSLGRKAMFVAKKELFQFRPLASFMRGIGAFPISRGKINTKAMRQANQVLAQGQVLAMFPEGMRSYSAQLQPAFSGSALIALRCCVPIIPVGIIGTEKFKGVSWMLRRPRIIVNIGHPFYLPSVNSRLTKERLAEHTDSIMRRIADLLPLEYRGHYAGEGN